MMFCQVEPWEKELTVPMPDSCNNTQCQVYRGTRTRMGRTKIGATVVIMSSLGEWIDHVSRGKFKCNAIVAQNWRGADAECAYNLARWFSPA